MNLFSDNWICRNFIRMVVGVGVLDCLLIAALFWTLGQTMDLNARLLVETKELRVQVNTHEARIKALAAENAWVREKVKISFEVAR